jgi:type I restriction enzyme M protein
MLLPDEPYFFVPLAEIEANNLDLSVGRYRETEHEEADYEPPSEILRRLRALDAEIGREMDELESMLR